MKKIFVFFVSILFAISAKCESILSADSIRIVGCDHNFESSIATGRYGFIERYSNMNQVDEEALPNYIDVTITNPVEVEKFLAALSSLDVVDTLSYSSQEVLMKAVYSKIAGNTVFWHEQTQMDVRLAAMIFQDSRVEFVWMDNLNIEMGYYRYKLSRKLKQILRRYTHFFD